MVNKSCLLCGKECIKRKRGESPSRFAERKYCSVGCANKGRTGPRGQSKACKHCKKQFKQREKEYPSKFKARLFCNRQCHAAFNLFRKQTKYVPCPICTKLFYKRKGRKYCSVKCYRNDPDAWGSRSFGELPCLYTPEEMAEALEEFM